MFGALLGFAGGLIGAHGAKKSASKAEAMAMAEIASAEKINQLNLDFAYENLDFQKDSMKNRYQWQYDDYRKAGINPILAGSQSAGTPSPVSMHLENPKKGQTANVVAREQMANNRKMQAIQSAIAIAQQRNQDKIADSTVEVNTARALKERNTADKIAEELKVNIPGLTAQFLGSSAKEKEANVNKIVASTKEIGQKIEESISRIQQIGNNIKYLKQQISESKSREKKMEYEKRLMRSQTELNRSITLVQAEIEEKVGLDVSILEGNVPGAEIKKEFLSKWYGRLLEKVKLGGQSIQPLSPAVLPAIMYMMYKTKGK